MNIQVRVLDANDNSPEFIELPNPIHVTENRVNVSICRLKARDLDAGNFGSVMYAIENPNKAFFINPKVS